MSEEIQIRDESRGMSPAVAMLIGLGIGVIGTVAVVALNEERFGQAVRTTKKRAKELGQKVHDRYEETLNNTRHKGAEAAYAVGQGAQRLGDKLSE